MTSTLRASTPRTSDVVVIGAGVAGFAAAHAAREKGASVVVVHDGASATSLSGGVWDLASDPTETARDAIESSWNQRERLSNFVDAHPEHPYARALDGRIDLIEDANEHVLSAIGGYRPLELDRKGVLVATELGLWRRSATAQSEVMDVRGGRQHLAVASTVPDRDAPFLAASLEEVLFPVSGVRVSALHLEDAPSSGDPAALGAALARAANVAGADAVLLPPPSPPEPAIDVLALQEQVGRPVGELVTSLAGPQGHRLQQRIMDALERLGCERVRTPVTELLFDRRGPSVVLRDGTVLRPGATVLATGKHVGGGLSVRSGVIFEPLAHLPIYAGGRLAPLSSSPLGPDPAVLFGTALVDAGPGYRRGLGYDAQLHVLEEHAVPKSDRLFAAGAILDGVDPSRDGSGFGVCAATGRAAGLAAARRAGAS